MVAGIVVAVIICGLICIPLVLKNLLFICQPNEVLIFSGDRRIVDGKPIGYRLVKGGRALKRPFVETVNRMDLTNMAIEVQVINAYSKGGIPLMLQAVANVKIAGNEPIINNAIERFLGKPRREIMRIAKETLEGNLRGVLATLTPEEVNDDKIAFQQSLVEEAEHDLTRLGLVLDTLNIQNVSDDKKYLDSIGRKRTAELQKRAFVAEVNSKSDAAVRSAENMRETAIAQVSADIETVNAETERRIIDAQTMRAAKVAEEEASIAALVARAEAQIPVQEARIEQTRRKLEADVIQPAKAALSAAQSKARGDASPIIENARANAEALEGVARSWESTEGKAKEVFLTQKLESLVSILTGTIGDLSVDKMTVLGDGNSNKWPQQLTVANEQLKATTGVDVPALLSSLTDKLRPDEEE